MIELQDIPFSLDAELLMRQQRVQPGTDNARAFAELLAKVREVGRPKAIYDVCYIEEKADDSVVLNGVRLTSRALRRNLDPVERVFPYVATCGTEADADRRAGRRRSCRPSGSGRSRRRSSTPPRSTSTTTSPLATA